jgi:HD-like signal output (HDOD) protein/CheY-like chemotaxis protein
MIKILFVDDEPNILEGLQRILRPMRHEWRMVFANSGAEALHVLSEENFDVIVTDMRMPGMDGSQLLTAVQQEYPQVVRFILSGYAEKALTLKSVGVAHQYLAKPCDVELLKASVSRTCGLGDSLSDSKMRRLVAQMKTVPSLPTLYAEVMHELQKADPSLRKIGLIIKEDIGMTVKILQMVNSAFFGLRRQISDTTDAVNFLGLDTITSLVLALGVFSQFERHERSKTAIAGLWGHSRAVGTMAKSIAAKESREAAHNAFTAGLLHDIGEVVLAFNMPQQFAQVQELALAENLSQTEAELRLFDASHAEIGAYLVGMWGLPEPVIEAVAFHHLPNASANKSFTALTAVHVADVLHRTASKHYAREHSPLDTPYLEKLGLLSRITAWQDTCEQFINL